MTKVHFFISVIVLCVWCITIVYFAVGVDVAMSVALYQQRVTYCTRNQSLSSGGKKKRWTTLRRLPRKNARLIPCISAKWYCELRSLTCLLRDGVRERDRSVSSCSWTMTSFLLHQYFQDQHISFSYFHFLYHRQQRYYYGHQITKLQTVYIQHNLFTVVSVLALALGNHKNKGDLLFPLINYNIA